MAKKATAWRWFVRVLGLAAALAGPVATGRAAMLTDSAAYASGAPQVIASSATGVTSTGATLNGSITPNGADATFQFQYGLTTSYGYSTPVQSVGGVSAQPVSAGVTGLAPATTYHFRLVGTNQNGTAPSNDMTFTTPSSSGAGGTVAAPPKPHLHATVNHRKHTAKFSLSDKTATGFQCALVKLGSGLKSHPKPRFRRCRSPKLYTKLAGKYEFFVRGIDQAGPGRAATFTFRI